jgi:hypothetical protein
MTLDFLIFVEREQFNEGSEETGIDNGRFVRWVDRDVSDTCGGGKD